jgi:predicted nucleotidyltransferase
VRTTRRGQSVVLLLDVVDVLRALQFNYAVIGAVAATVHGTMRASKDADVLLSGSPDDAPTLERAFQNAGFRTFFTRGDPEDDIPGLLRVADQYANEVDVLLGLKGLDRKAFARTIEVPFQGVPLRFIGREDFIAMKVFAGGPVDLQDAERAVAANPQSLDLSLVRRLAAGFGREASVKLESVLDAELKSRRP